MSIRYFAYGSNMSVLRLEERVATVRLVDIGLLARHRLAFHKVGFRDGSAKCDIVATDNGDSVWGVVFELDVSAKSSLDRVEGLHQGYEEREVEIELESGGGTRAVTYYATHIDPDLKPFSWYKRHVLEGALQAGLPASYVYRLEEVQAIEDPEAEREARELRIYD